MGKTPDSDGYSSVQFLEIDIEGAQIVFRQLRGMLRTIREDGSGLTKPAYDFGSAHFMEYDSTALIPGGESLALDFISQCVITGIQLSSKHKKAMVPVEEVVTGILRQETSLPIEPGRIMYVSGSTRTALDHVFHTVATQKRHAKTIAIPIPNWHFHSICGEMSFQFFDGRSEERLVENFEHEAKAGKLCALVLAYPTVPLMQTLSEPAAREIDETALAYGIDIIVDDVLRGLHHVGQRDSIGRFFTRPYVVEGFSKRYGDGPLAKISYVLAPDAKAVKKLVAKIPIDKPVYDGLRFCSGTLLDRAYRHATEPALAELQSRNEAFDTGFSLFAPPDARVVRPSPYALTSLVQLPERCRYRGNEFEKTLEGDIELWSMDAFVPEKGVPDVDSLRQMKAVRITVGQMNRKRVYEGARVLGMKVSMATPV